MTIESRGDPGFLHFMTLNTKPLRYWLSGNERRWGWSGPWERVSRTWISTPASLAAQLKVRRRFSLVMAP